MDRAGMKNRYTCNTCGQSIITVNTDNGTTPFGISCKFSGCNGVMFSSGYQIDQSLDADFVWYKPKSLKKLDKQTRDHVRKGGLLLKRVKGD